MNCAVYTVGNVADDDTNTYIYYTFIIIHYTVRISLFSCISTLQPLPSPHFSRFRSVPLQPISSGYYRKPHPASGTRRRWELLPF